MLLQSPVNDIKILVLQSLNGGATVFFLSPTMLSIPLVFTHTYNTNHLQIMLLYIWQKNCLIFHIFA